MDKLCGDELCGDKLCVDKLCVDKLCGDKLCEEKLWAAGGRREAGAQGGCVQPKTRTPHKDVGFFLGGMFFGSCSLVLWSPGPLVLWPFFPWFLLIPWSFSLFEYGKAALNMPQTNLR